MHAASCAPSIIHVSLHEEKYFTHLILASGITEEGGMRSLHVIVIDEIVIGARCLQHDQYEGVNRLIKVSIVHRITSFRSWP